MDNWAFKDDIKTKPQIIQSETSNTEEVIY